VYGARIVNEFAFENEHQLVQLNRDFPNLTFTVIPNLFQRFVSAKNEEDDHEY
jgi:hypothetical protein